MSKSLNINVPQIVQTKDTLNAVPSGSTATPDENVKYVPQDLTEAQKAQARENIGAGTPQVQADWNQTDTTAADYIKNKPESFGGDAAYLDRYWIVYPEGDTTISLHAGTINKLWMDGYERSATEGVYTVYKGSTVRIDASANASFIFSNTTDPIWLWSPAGINVNEPVYGTMQNVNLVNRNGGGSNLNFGGRMWLMNNKFSTSMYTMTDVAVSKSPRIYLSDTPIDVNIQSQDTPDLDYCGVIFYVPVSRYEELKTKLTTKYGESWFRRFAYNIVQVQSITQCDNTLDVVYCDVEDAYATITIYNDSNNTYQDTEFYQNNWVNGVLIGNEVDGKFIDLATVCGTGWGGCGGERIIPQHMEDRLTIYPGKNVFVMNFSKDQDNNNKMFPSMNYSGISDPLWIYAKKMYANPLMAHIRDVDSINFVFIDFDNDSFGHDGGGTSFIYNKNNEMMDTRFYLINNNKVVLTNQPMSGVHKGGVPTQASDVLATVYCPRSRYDELVAKYEELYATEIAGGTFQLSWITDHIVKYDYIENVDYKKVIVSFDTI